MTRGECINRRQTYKIRKIYRKASQCQAARCITTRAFHLPPFTEHERQEYSACTTIRFSSSRPVRSVFLTNLRVEDRLVEPLVASMGSAKRARRGAGASRPQGLRPDSSATRHLALQKRYLRLSCPRCLDACVDNLLRRRCDHWQDIIVPGSSTHLWLLPGG